MGLVSAAAVGTARVWWVVRYWTPRAHYWRGRAKSLELGIEYQLTRELPAADPWRQQVEADIDTHFGSVPTTAALVQALIDDRPRGSHRWHRRQLRAVRRARLRGGEVTPRVDAVATRRGRRVLLRFAPVAAALTLGYFAGPIVHPSPAPSTPPAGRFVLQGGFVLPANMPIFSDSVLTPDQRRQIRSDMNKLHRPPGR